MLIEVLSKSTQNYDRGEKLVNYRTIPSLKEYLTIAQDSIHVEHWRRQPDDSWLLAEFHDRSAVISLESANAELRVADIYESIEFTPD